MSNLIEVYYAKTLEEVQNIVEAALKLGFNASISQTDEKYLYNISIFKRHTLFSEDKE